MAQVTTTVLDNQPLVMDSSPAVFLPAAPTVNAVKTPETIIVLAQEALHAAAPSALPQPNNANSAIISAGESTGFVNLPIGNTPSSTPACCAFHGDPVGSSVQKSSWPNFLLTGVVVSGIMIPPARLAFTVGLARIVEKEVARELERIRTKAEQAAAEQLQASQRSAEAGSDHNEPHEDPITPPPASSIPAGPSAVLCHNDSEDPFSGPSSLSTSSTTPAIVAASAAGSTSHNSAATSPSLPPKKRDPHCVSLSPSYICRRHAAGYCRFQTDCRFAHICSTLCNTSALASVLQQGPPLALENNNSSDWKHPGSDGGAHRGTSSRHGHNNANTSSIANSLTGGFIAFPPNTNLSPLGAFNPMPTVLLSHPVATSGPSPMAYPAFTTVAGDPGQPPRYVLAAPTANLGGAPHPFQVVSAAPSPAAHVYSVPQQGFAPQHGNSTAHVPMQTVVSGGAGQGYYLVSQSTNGAMPLPQTVGYAPPPPPQNLNQSNSGYQVYAPQGGVIMSPAPGGWVQQGAYPQYVSFAAPQQASSQVQPQPQSGGYPAGNAPNSTLVQPGWTSIPAPARR